MLVDTTALPHSKSPYMEELLSLVQNEHLIDIIAEQEIDSIKMNKEETFYVCGDKIIKLVGVKTADKAIVFNPPDVISDVCGTIPPWSIHFHGPYLSYQSPSDRKTHKHLFGKGFSMGCSFGIDGGKCLVPTGHEYTIPWSERFYERASKKGVGILDDVSSVVCIQLDNTNNNKECTIKTRDGKPQFKNIFSEQVWEQDSAIQPYMWFREGDDISFIEKSSFKKTMCAVSETEVTKKSKHIKDNVVSLFILGSRADKLRKKRILTCFFRKEQNL